MKRVKNSIKDFVKRRKLSSLILLVVVIGIGYWTYGKLFPTRDEISYVVTDVKRGDIETSVAGTGQITASSQIDMKSKVSGDIVYLNTKANGAKVRKDTLIAQIDAKDAYIDLESAKISYEKLIKPATASDILKAESALNDAIATNKKSYEDAFAAITSTFIDIPSIKNGLNSLLYTNGGYLETEHVRSNGGNTSLTYRDKAGLSYDKTINRYEIILAQYKNLSRTSSSTTLENILYDTYLLAKDMSETLKNAQSAVEYIKRQKDDSTGDVPASNISSWTSIINTNLNNLLSIKTIMLSSANSIKEKSLDLADLKDGPDSLDIRSEKLSLQQKENAYQEYFIRTPFDGILARLTVKPTDSVSSGDVIGTLVSYQKIATITLNEVDVEKVKVGQRADLTFDAISELIIKGTIATVDMVGTISQGVVNYNVEIALDEQDERIKSGMSVTASIVTSTKKNILIVPNSAVKSQNRSNYVEIFPTPLIVEKGTSGTPSSMKPIQKKIEIGISSDSFTEIISGLNAGDQIITRTLNSNSSTKTTSNTPTLFGGNSTRIGGGNNSVRTR